GGNFSGPIVKNRIFFFWSGEGRRERRGQVLSAGGPAAAEKRGGFCGPLFRSASPRPRGGCTTSTTSGWLPRHCHSTKPLSPAGLAFVKLFPDPTGPGIGDWATSQLQPIDTRQDSIRGDITLNDKTNLMVRYINEKWTHLAATGNFWGDSAYPTLASDWNQPSPSFVVKLTNSLTSKAVNEFQFSIAGNDIIISTSPDTQALQDEIASKFPTVFPHADGTIGGTSPSLFWGAGGYSNIWHQAPWANRE